MKKLNSKLFAIVFSILGLSACTEWLDIRPESEVVLEDFWQTEEQATAVLASAYRAFTLDAVVSRMVVWGELRSDNVIAGNLFDLDMQRVLSVNIIPTNNYANWGDFYTIINYCNTFLYYAPQVLERDQSFTPTKLKALEAEAKALRAMAYFYLVRAFKEVPLVLNPSIDDLQDYNVGKSTERVVLDQIIKDLLEAKVDARENYNKGAYNKGRITKTSINALLADVYLWDNQYQNCINACNNVIADSSLALVDGDDVLTKVFYDGNSTESIFELQYDEDIQFNNVVNSYYGYGGNPLGQLSFPVFLTHEKDKSSTFSPFYFSASATPESTDDIREYHSFGTANNGDGYAIYKYALIQCVENADQSYTPRYRSTANTVNWVVYRLSDIYLMKAEALTQLDGNDNLAEALRMVNKTYLRSNQTADSLAFTNYSDQNLMEKLVLRERQRELLFEGKRWFDLMRMVRRKEDASAILSYLGPKLSGDNMQMKKLSVMDGLYFPVLKSQLDINPKLTQNPFYENDEYVN